MSVAALQVLNTTELPEMVLFSLCDGSDTGLATLLRSTRVNRKFRDVIKQAPHRQRALFLRDDRNGSDPGNKDHGFNSLVASSPIALPRAIQLPSLGTRAIQVSIASAQTKSLGLETQVIFGFENRGLPSRFLDHWLWKQLQSSWLKMKVCSKAVTDTHIVVRHGLWDCRMIQTKACKTEDPTFGELIALAVQEPVHECGMTSLFNSFYEDYADGTVLAIRKKGEHAQADAEEEKRGPAFGPPWSAKDLLPGYMKVDGSVYVGWERKRVKW
ncbi:hypothetical protein PRZ48_014056 [Zasmidium cellare]|uniref:F-box domain-containing protein n=1 Tax=Zasmidium cellare TaxID=395010 RepID=A0ABR0DZV6_ZASCE|nr:hypothetical protein PRZ48_014056 [Zasmidium cellare]